MPRSLWRRTAGPSLVPRRLRRAMQLALALALVAGAVFAWRSGLLHDLSLASVRERARAAGAWGPPLFVLLFTAGEFLHVPSLLFPLAAGWVWPLPLALVTSWFGAVFAATVVFSVARYLLADWVRDLLPSPARRVDERLVEHGVRNVALLRLFTFMMPIMHWLLGVSRVSFRDFLLGTALGLLPGVVALVFLGERFTYGWQTAWPWVLAVAAAAAALHAARRWRARHRPPPSPPA